MFPTLRGPCSFVDPGNAHSWSNEVVLVALGNGQKNDGSLAYDVSFLISQLRCLCGAFGLHALAGEQGLGAGVHFPSQAPKDQGPWRGYLSPIVGTPNREPQEYSRNIIGIYLSGSFDSRLYTHYILGVPCLGFPLSRFAFGPTPLLLLTRGSTWGEARPLHRP